MEVAWTFPHSYIYIYIYIYTHVFFFYCWQSFPEPHTYYKNGTSRIQNGNWDIDADCVNSVNQGLSWEAGDTLGWGKAQGRAETSGLWTPSQWETSPHHDTLKEQVGRHTHATAEYQSTRPLCCRPTNPTPSCPTSLSFTGPLSLCPAWEPGNLSPAQLASTRQAHCTVPHRPARPPPCGRGRPPLASPPGSPDQYAALQGHPATAPGLQGHCPPTSHPDLHPAGQPGRHPPTNPPAHRLLPATGGP
jgi:hypothetical protein